MVSEHVTAMTSTHLALVVRIHQLGILHMLMLMKCVARIKIEKFNQSIIPPHVANSPACPTSDSPVSISLSDANGNHTYSVG